jgi:hypothetical protein
MHVMCHWKNIFERYKILPLIFQNRCDLRKYMNVQSFGTIKIPILGLPLEFTEKK